VTLEQCFAASGYKILFTNSKKGEDVLVQASLSRTLKLIPSMLEGMV
jgi:hypothetical protein